VIHPELEEVFRGKGGNQPTPLETGAWIAALARDLCIHDHPHDPHNYLEVGCHRGSTFTQVGLALREKAYLYGVEPDGVAATEALTRTWALATSTAGIFQLPFDEFVSSGRAASVMPTCRLIFWDEGMDGGKKTYLEDFKKVIHLVNDRQIHLWHDADGYWTEELVAYLHLHGFDTVQLPVPRGVLIGRQMRPVPLT